jgi:hypothetical protein
MSSNVALSSIAALSLVLGANVALAQNAVTHSPPSERTSQSGIVDPNVRKNQGGIVDPNFKPTQGQIIDPNNRGGVDPNFHSSKAGSERMGIIVNDRKNAVTHTPPSDRTGQSGVIDPNYRKSQSGIVDPNFKPTQGQVIDPNIRNSQGSLIDPNLKSGTSSTGHAGTTGSERMGIIMPGRK